MDLCSNSGMHMRRLALVANQPYGQHGSRAVGPDRCDLGTRLIRHRRVQRTAAAASGLAVPPGGIGHLANQSEAVLFLFGIGSRSDLAGDVCYEAAVGHRGTIGPRHYSAVVGAALAKEANPGV